MALSSPTTSPIDPREQEARMLVELVRLSRVTLLIAESGSDKSAFVRSTVLPVLQVERGAPRKEVPVLLDWWERLPLAVLNARIDEALAGIFGDAAHAVGDHGAAHSLSTRLAARQRIFNCSFIIILDRFEEYLAAAAENPDLAEFESQFVEAVESRTLGANFLLSLDEDAAPLLARLRERIPGLGDSRLRLPKVESVPAGERAEDAAQSRDQLIGSLRAAPTPAGQDANVSQRIKEAVRVDAGMDRREPAMPKPVSRVDAIANASVEENEPAPTTSAEENPSVENPSVRAATPIHSEPERLPRRISRRHSILAVIMLAILSGLLVLAPRRADEPAPVRRAESPPKAEPASGQVQSATPAQPENEPAAVSEPVRVPAPSAGEQAQAAPSRSAETFSAATAPSRTADEADPRQSPIVESPTVAEPPPTRTQRRTPEKTGAPANVPATPQLYIHVRNESQRAYAQRMVEPLARHGIRVTGIRVVSSGPPVSDLRYFRAADRAEALKINHALDVVGTPAARLNYMRGSDDAASARRYELWLPPS